MEYSESYIELLKREIDYYIAKIEEANMKKDSLESKSIASDNYYDREIFYCEYHLFKAQAELNRLENCDISRILK